METKINKKINKGFRVFPRVFKKIGIAVCSLALISLVLCLCFKMHGELLRIGIYDFLMIGLLFYSFSADKIEDERIAQIRLNALAGALVFTVIYTMVAPLVGMLLDRMYGSTGTTPQGPAIILSAMFMYNFWFYFLKRKS